MARKGVDLLKSKYDILIIGAGPAGMTAAIYACRAGQRVLLLADDCAGGQMNTTPTVENYPALPVTAGWELTEQMREQVEALGAEMIYERAVSIEKSENGSYRIDTERNNYRATVIIIANGVKRRQLNIPGEQSLLGRGVSQCATCDGPLFRGKNVAVIGGGNTALEDALYLSGICSQVYLIHRHPTFHAQKTLIDRLDAHRNIIRHMNTVPVRINGNERVDGLVIHECGGDHSVTRDVSAVFVAIGLIPDNGMFASLLSLDPAGYIKTDERCATGVAGIFAAGDTRAKELRQIVTATADGAVAATEACRYLEQTKGSSS